MNPTQQDQTTGFDAKQSPRVVVSILNWRGWRDTIDCLASVRRLRYPNYLTVVVDNGSGEASLEELRAWARAHFQEGDAFVEYCREVALAGGDTAREESLERCASSRRLVLIDNAENLGFTGGNNVAIQYAFGRPQPADCILLLNNDATVEKDCLTRLLEAAQVGEAGIVGAVIKERQSGDIQFAGCVGSFPLLRQFFQPLWGFRTAVPSPGVEFQESFWVSGAAVLVRREVLEGVHRLTGHYLDDDLFLYWEEVDFCGQARKLGYKSVVANRALVYHGEAASSGGRYNPIAYYYTNRNRVQVAGHLLPWPLRPLFHGINIPLCLGRAVKNLLRGRRDAARAILRGMFDGYWGISGKWKHHDEVTGVYTQG
jgi:GT2 family glycosyltransferase